MCSLYDYVGTLYSIVLCALLPFYSKVNANISSGGSEMDEMLSLFNST